MKLFKQPALWFALSAAAVIIIMWGGTTSDTKSISRFFFLRFYRSDLVIHYLQFAMLAWFLLRWLDTAQLIYRNKINKWIPFLICFLIGGVNEILQTRIPERSGAFDDQISNAIGALTVTFLYLHIKRKNSNNNNKKE